jgi:hypothetical protein
VPIALQSRIKNKTLQIMKLLIKKISPVTFAAVGPDSKIEYDDIILFCNYFVVLILAVIND